jgi:hypothetical protein
VAAQVDSGFTLEYYDARLDMFFGSKHTSLLQRHTHIEEMRKKELYDTVPGYKITLSILKPFFSRFRRKNVEIKNSDIFFVKPMSFETFCFFDHAVMKSILLVIPQTGNTN